MRGNIAGFSSGQHSHVVARISPGAIRELPRITLELIRATGCQTAIVPRAHCLSSGRATQRNRYTASPAKADTSSTSITPRLKRNKASAAAAAINAEGQSKLPAKPCGQSTW